jgi:ankyrin repeat protein
LSVLHWNGKKTSGCSWLFTNFDRLIEFVDDANNAPAGTDWAKWKSKYRKRSPLFGQIIELFRASAAEQPKTHKVIHNLLDQKDKKFCWTPLHWACSAGRTDKMKVLLDHGADPFILSNQNVNIIHAAVESKALNGLVGALEIWKRYPQQLNINQVNRWAETPLLMAARESVECVKLLLEAGADPNVPQEDQQVALHSAGLSTRGAVRREIVALLCGDDGPHINMQDVDGRPPIFEFLDDPDCLELFLNHGARIDLLDTSGKSLFHHACIQDESEALKMLLHHFPDTVMVTVKDHDGNSPLIQALRHRSIDCAMIILKLENVGDIVGQDGWTAAHHAAKLGDVDVLEAVLKHSSFVKGMKTIDGKTVEVVAMEAGNWCGEVKGLVRRHNSLT